MYIFPIILGLLDSVSLPIIELSRSSGNYLYLMISYLISFVQINIFYYALKFSNLTMLNISWDLMSDVIVTIYGIFILGDIDLTCLSKGTIYKIIGLITSFLSLFLLNYKE